MVSVFLLLSLLSSLVSRKVKGNSLLPAPEGSLGKCSRCESYIWHFSFCICQYLSLFFIVSHLFFVCVHLIIWWLFLNVWGTFIVSFEEDRGLSRGKMYLHNKKAFFLSSVHTWGGWRDDWALTLILLLQRALGRVLEPASGDTQALVTAAPKDPTHSSGFPGHLCLLSLPLSTVNCL